MNNTISENTKVILLLTSFFNNNELRQFKPLTVNGYGYFARWLNTYRYQPADLLQQEKLNIVLEHWLQADSHPVVKLKVDLKKLDQTIADITPDRIKTLLGRGASLSMAIDKWSSAGIWILDRSHPYYPKKLKDALKDQTPAILFGTGNMELLSKSSIGFVGSRDCEEVDEDATIQYVNTINQNGFQVVSGAAKGVDSLSMLTSLQNGHSSIGIVADSLFKASVNNQWRKYLKSEQLVLITPFYPEGKFSPANAMQRNKFIYLLSQATVVIRATESSASKKSGTWEGAKENLQKGWVPLMISEHTTPNYPANQALLDGEIKKSKIQPQKITLPISSDDFLILLNTGEIEHVSQRVETVNKQVSLLGDDMFEPEVSTVASLAIPKIANSYANKDEYDVSSKANLTYTKTSGDLHCIKPKTEKVKLSGDNVNDLSDTDANHLSQVSSVVDEDSCKELKLINEVNVATLTPIEDSPDNEVLVNEMSNKLALSPILTTFFEQVTALIESTPEQSVTFTQLEIAFPEFTIISKTALNKWIKYLVEQNYLSQPNTRKKVYSIAS